MQLHIALLAALIGVSPVLNSSLGWAGDAGVQSSGKNHSGGVLPKPSSGDSSRGKTLYDASCIVCQGPGATGGIGPRLAGKPVLSNEQAFWTVVYEGQHMMPPLAGTVTEQQMADIRAWLLTLR